MKKICWILLACVGALPASAGSLSELNRTSFDQGMATDEAATEQSPFVPKPVAKGELLVQDLRLTGLVVGESTSYALISGHAVSTGDRIAGFSVKQIGTDHVILQHLDKRVVLHLREGL